MHLIVWMAFWMMCSFCVFSISFESQISTGLCLSWSRDFAIHSWLVYACYSDQWPAYLNNALDQWRAFFMVQLVPSLFLPHFPCFFIFKLFIEFSCVVLKIFVSLKLLPSLIRPDNLLLKITTQWHIYLLNINIYHINLNIYKTSNKMWDTYKRHCSSI